MANQDIRKYAKQKGVKLWQIASEKGISEPTMTRLLRKELPENEKTELFRIINALAERSEADKSA